MSIPEDNAAFAQNKESESQQPATRCMRCHTALAPNGAYKHTCDVCHKIIGAKVNAKLKKDANKALAKMRAAAVPAVVQHSASVPAFKLAVEPPKPPIVVKSKATTGATSAPQPPKRKLEEVSGTQTGEEDSRPFKVTAHKGKEYQTGDALLDALAAQWQGPRATRDASSSTAQAHVNFMGGYTVVLDPSVSSETRVEQLTGACKASSKRIPIGKLVRRFNGASERHSREYWCICAGVATPPSKPPNAPAAAASPVPSQPLDAIPKSGAPLKRSQSTLTTWLAAVRPSTQGGRSGAEEDAPGRGVCGGTIGVDAVTDFSHPLARKGIKGQRVTRTGVASRRIDVSEDRRTHREARPRSTSMSAADSGTSSTTDVLPPSRTVGGSQEFRTPLLGAGLIVGLIIVICRYFYS
ncbi:uncharacterized protein TRAVEDRAFT_20305 [Trametes versicolor FP-101664 SS1]|uniref:uncharacterized protein n=1 Tax=Trametes versicolor (strain FP-101664) TaxID=717944 RepID=UPI00046234E8|nr:uncharacterized protein TRAVEDRAFT_20305 [Trametes versicolor FP-101664 SS1]EIW58235.1 hypothetical protein TRAVEDRAFT_20305 [Trametes versicolor FP-101664 SS1]